MVIVLTTVWEASGHGWTLSLDSVDGTLETAQLNLRLDRFWHADESGARINMPPELVDTLRTAAEENEELEDWLRQELQRD